MNKVILDVYSKIKYITYRRHFLSLSSICRNGKAHDIESTLRKGGTQVAPSLFVFTFTPLLPPPPGLTFRPQILLASDLSSSSIFLSSSTSNLGKWAITKCLSGNTGKSLKMRMRKMRTDSLLKLQCMMARIQVSHSS